jgi:hypothetical protein
MSIVSHNRTRGFFVIVASRQSDELEDTDREDREDSKG